MMMALVFHYCISGYEAFFSIPTHTVAQGGRTGSISYCMSYISNQLYSTLHIKFHLVFEPFHNNIQYCFSHVEIYLHSLNRNAHFIMFQSICTVLVYTLLPSRILLISRWAPPPLNFEAGLLSVVKIILNFVRIESKNVCLYCSDYE